MHTYIHIFYLVIKPLISLSAALKIALNTPQTTEKI